MNKPVLVVMAAGMGSRYGGLKQIDPLGPNGEIIIDYSIYDAKQAGFETVIFIIKKEIENDFKTAIGARVEKQMNVLYAFQETSDLPVGYSLPDERVKPWGTAHALCAIRGMINSPFAVINADDYYGPSAFKAIYDYLAKEKPANPYPFTMVAYPLENTLTENGYVSRGVCTVNENHMLVEVIERTNIEKDGEHAKYTLDEGKTYHKLSADSLVSMNLWGFTQDFVTEAWDGFSDFLDTTLKTNPLKGEYYLPSVVSNLIEQNKAEVYVLASQDKWYGVTYKEDRERVKDALTQMHQKGMYNNI